MSGHYMTKEGVPIICKNCLYWSYKGVVIGTCGNANQKQRIQFYFKDCEHFWPKQEHRK